MRGKVIAVCTSGIGNVPKYPQNQVLVSQYGFASDVHAGPTRISHRTQSEKFNDHQVSLVAQEALDYINKELGISLRPGHLGENITTEGLGDLSAIPDGTLLEIGGVVLEVTEQNQPCKNLLVYHPLLVKTAYGRRGLFAVVKEGEGLIIRPHLPIEILPS